MKYTHSEHIDTNEPRETNNKRPRRDAYTHDERDVSADWREEYRHQEVDPRIRSDGGRFILPGPGQVVVDHKSKDRAELLVVSVHPNTKAKDEYIPEIGKTVAEVNRMYSSDAPVGDVVYVDSVVDTLGEDPALGEVRDAIEQGALRSYTFPVDRLSLQGGEQ
jgi:hypothetical protein